MMIVSKKSSIYFFVISVSILFILFGFYAYMTVFSLESAGGEEIKTAAEKIFFRGIIFFILILSSGLSIIIKSFKFEKSVDKLLLMSRTHGFSTAVGLKKLGRLGNKLSEIYQELGSVSERKSLKIASLNRLINIIFTFIEKKVIVFTVTGEIVFVSESVVKKEGDSLSLKNRMITDIFPDFSLSSEVDSLVSERAMKKIERLNALIYPVFNAFNELDYMVLFLDEHINLTIIPSSKEMINSMKKSRFNFFSRRKKEKFLNAKTEKSD